MIVGMKVLYLYWWFKCFVEVAHKSFMIEKWEEWRVYSISGESARPGESKEQLGFWCGNTEREESRIS